ncbi:hypothetical protein R3W88_017377 [Solanum pinnatisectum]|uniref:Cell-wall invertase n=1 Tax=Solanum pinnatisectum TaxID=50273 RepID=A0AAV9L0H1_9SOLN|nr:hypothetical protein R3W88_017377 [Solanum pinnatisectum]
MAQPYRTAYHFQPLKNWTFFFTDLYPNGPMIYKGIYHLFYQYNPKSAKWANIAWDHSTSTDLVNWTIHPPALLPSDPFDFNGCWSGSTTILQDGTPAILYTGGVSQKVNLQNLAVPKDPSDPYLVEWIKSPHNPIMTPKEEEKTWFRDPTTAWLGTDRIWRVIIGNKRENRGTALLYKSEDFIHWTEAERPLHSSNETTMSECPDFFPVSIDEENGLDTLEIFPGIKHVLKISAMSSSGSVDNESGLRLDYGKYYASKYFFDSEKKRRISIAWVNESTSKEINLIRGWCGLQCFPRKIWLDSNLIQWPVEEIEMLRTNKYNTGSCWTNPQEIANKSGSSANTGVGPFGLLVLASNNIEEYTAIYFIIFKKNDKFFVLMGCDQKRSSVGLEYVKTNYGAFLDIDPLTEKLSLRTLIDHSIVKSFGGGGKTCITTRAYPTLAINDNAHLFVFNNGSQHVDISNLNAWSLSQAHIN